jgi:hypothetical protein
MWTDVVWEAVHGQVATVSSYHIHPCSFPLSLTPIHSLTHSLTHSPSSQSSPSHLRSAFIASSLSRVERAVSVSSILNKQRKDKGITMWH